MASKHTHSPDALKEIAEEHLRYELQMVCVLSGFRTGPVSQLGEAVILEAFMVHARSVDSFFSEEPNSGPDHTGVSAKNYLAAWKRDHVLTEKERQVINRRIAHLDCERTLAGFTWTDKDRHDIAVRLVNRAKEFVGQLAADSTDRALLFTSAISSCDDLLRTTHVISVGGEVERKPRDRAVFSSTAEPETFRSGGGTLLP